MGRTTICLTLFSYLLISVTSAPTKQGRDSGLGIYSFHINSTVTSRYAITTITSRVANRLEQSKEVHFEVKIPKNAFISKFKMIIENVTYDGIVKKKEEAQQQYNQAVSRGESAGIVSSVGRTLEDFKTSVTIAALSKVTFELTYEELLKRRLGKYELLINAQPMQPVSDFKIDVYIKEQPGISSLKVKGGLTNQNLSSAITTTQAKSNQEAWVNFYPTLQQQLKCCELNGLNGDLIITYDVKRQEANGELKAVNGYFVHYFAPTNIQRIPKNVVFIIDRSGSMHGRKMEQTRTALLKILEDLSPDDFFGLITFDSEIDVWKSELLPATEENLNRAKMFVKQIQDRGATDINDAVLKGADMIRRFPRVGSASLLILLTDGDPTSGVIHTDKIQANVKEAIGGKYPLYCLGFGYDVNFGFLEKMSLENNGVARRIYADSDADLQLQGFYDEVATPLLTDVQLNYIGAANLTQTSFSLYYNGSEIVVAGQLTDNSLDTLETEVIAISRSSQVKYQDSVSTKDVTGMLPQHEDFVQRLWAYLTVKQLLEKEMTLQGDEKKDVQKKALELSLKYTFVTPLTSMVVTKPQEEEVQVAHKPKEGNVDDRAIIRHLPPHTPVMSKHPRMRTSGFLPFPGQLGVPGPSYRQSPKIQPNQQHDRFPGQYALMSPGHFPKQHSPIHQDVDDLLVGDDEEDPAPAYDGHDAARILNLETTPTHIPSASNVRFLISAVPKPVCFDTPVNNNIRLLLDSSSDITINGVLSDKGFQSIVLHYKTAKLHINPNNITYTIKSDILRLLWKKGTSNHDYNGMSLIMGNNEVDITMGMVRVVVLLHNEGGIAFLWPAVRQQPKDVDMQGLLGNANMQYEELPGSKIKLNDQEVKATGSTAVDYRVHSAPAVECLLVPFQAAMQGDLSDYTVAKL